VQPHLNFQMAWLNKHNLQGKALPLPMHLHEVMAARIMSSSPHDFRLMAMRVACSRISKSCWRE
jgi:hypothetical protein